MGLCKNNPLKSLTLLYLRDIIVLVTKGGIQLNKDDIKRQLNNIWKEVGYVDNKVYSNKMSHSEAIVALSKEMKKLTIIVNEIVDTL